jgi:hypothetical protein
MYHLLPPAWSRRDLLPLPGFCGIITIGESGEILSLSSIRELMILLNGLFSCCGVGGAVERYIYSCPSAFLFILPHTFPINTLSQTHQSSNTRTMSNHSRSEQHSRAMSSYESMSPENQERIVSLALQTFLASVRGDQQTIDAIANEALPALGVESKDGPDKGVPPSEGASSAANTAVPATDTNSTQKASTTGTAGTQNRPIFGPVPPPKED